MLDGNSSLYPGFQPGDNETGQAVLFGAAGLQQGYAHHIEITNVGEKTRSSVLDINYASGRHSCSASSY